MPPPPPPTHTLSINTPTHIRCLSCPFVRLVLLSVLVEYDTLCHITLCYTTLHHARHCSRAGKGKNKKYSGDDAAASGGVSVTASSIAASGVRCRSSSSDMISNDGASGGFGPAGGGGGGVSSGLGGMGCVDPSSSSCDTRDDTCMDTMDNGSLIGGGGHHLTTAAAGRSIIHFMVYYSTDFNFVLLPPLSPTPRS